MHNKSIELLVNLDSGYKVMEEELAQLIGIRKRLSTLTSADRKLLIESRDEYMRVLNNAHKNECDIMRTCQLILSNPEVIPNVPGRESDYKSIMDMCDVCLKRSIEAIGVISEIKMLMVRKLMAGIY